MPMKCIDQMPHPMEIAPPASQMRAEGLCALLATRDDKFSAVCETKMATATESRTSQTLYVPTTAGDLQAKAHLGHPSSIGLAAVRLSAIAAKTPLSWS